MPFRRQIRQEYRGRPPAGPSKQDGGSAGAEDHSL